MAERIVLLDRIEAGAPLPEYCTHGRATCVVCGEWCWLGSATHNQVVHLGATPICLPCANRHLKDSQPTGHVRDHRRADGPHT